MGEAEIEYSNIKTKHQASSSVLYIFYYDDHLLVWQLSVRNNRQAIWHHAIANVSQYIAKADRRCMSYHKNVDENTLL